MRKRIRSLIKKLASGQEFFTNNYPWISKAEINEIEKLVDHLQIESVHGAEVGSPRAVYPIDLEIFRAKAEELGDE